MVWQFGPYFYITAVAGAVSLVIAHLTWQRRPAPGSVPLSVVNVAGAIWAWTTALELGCGTLAYAAFFHKLSFIGIVVIGPALFVFAAEYTGRVNWISPKKLLLLSALPVVSLVLIWTSEHHTLFWQALAMDTSSPMAILRKTPGIWWWVDSAYTYGLVGVAVLILGAMFVREPGPYRRQIAAILAAIVVPAALDSAYISRGISDPVNLAPSLFAWVGLVLYWGFARYQLLDLTPVAREFVVDHLGDSLIVTDNSKRVVYVNAAAEKLLNKQSRSMVGSPIADILAENPGLLSPYRKVKEGTAELMEECEHEGRYFDGRLSVLRDSRDHVRGSVLVLRDTTDRKEAELALEESRRELERRVESRTAELAREKEHLALLNRVAVEMADCTASAQVLDRGLKLACEAVGCGLGALWVRSHGYRMRLVGTSELTRDQRQHLQRLLKTSPEVEEAMRGGLPVCTTIWEEGEESRGLPASVTRHLAVVPLVSRRRNLGVLCLGHGDDRCVRPDALALSRGIASQIAVALENVRRYEDVRTLAEKDSLTGLLNHRGTTRLLDREVTRSARNESVFSVVMIDVDRFKLFNDTYGHVVGDQVLRRAARLLTDSLRRSDAVGRFGGDEFIAILRGADAQAAVSLVERLRSAVSDHRFEVDGGRELPLSMSYGIAVYPGDGRTVSELLAAADANLYRAKQKGGNHITVSESEEASSSRTAGSFTVLDGLVTAVDNKDHYTRQHSDDVTRHALALASKLGLSLETQRSLRVAAILHDVGKVGVPDQILRKPAGLTEEEAEVVRQHVTLGELIINGIPNQEEVLSAVGSHHERFDGKGYPRGLKGMNIPVLGRLLAVTDAYSAMTIDRPYRKALSAADAKAELNRIAGTQLDPKMVEAFLELLEEDDIPVSAGSLPIAVA